jgi:hypothetical protein
VSTRALSQQTSADRLIRLADDIRQLTHPIHIAIRGRIETLPCLLDALNEALTPGSALTGPERRHPPDSAPPLRLDVLDASSTIQVGIAQWRAHLHLASPPRDADWYKATLHALVGATPALAPSIADQLADDVRSWWRLAAVHTGWHPDDLLRLR